MSFFERIFLSLFPCLLLFDQIYSQFEWINYDKIDEIMERINSVNSINCFEKQPSELVLPDEAVYQKPSIEMLRKQLIMRNRTQLMHVRNIAHRNALLYSYLFQRLFDAEEPGLAYILLHNAGRNRRNLELEYSVSFSSGCDCWSWYDQWFRNLFRSKYILSTLVQELFQ